MALAHAGYFRGTVVVIVTCSLTLVSHVLPHSSPVPLTRPSPAMSAYATSRSIDSTTQLVYSRTPTSIIQQHVLETFPVVDSGHKGYLTRHDLRCAVILLLGYTPSHIEISALLTTAGCRTPSERLTLDRFVPLLTRRIEQQDTLQYYQQLFAAFDTEGRGFIRRDDFMRVCQCVTVKGAVDRSMLERLFDVCDVDGDGVVSYREFDRLMSARPYSTV